MDADLPTDRRHSRSPLWRSNDSLITTAVVIAVAALLQAPPLQAQ
jgi:hypothetical protein